MQKERKVVWMSKITPQEGTTFFYRVTVDDMGWWYTSDKNNKDQSEWSEMLVKNGEEAIKWIKSGELHKERLITSEDNMDD
jgi:hypothetical protein